MAAERPARAAIVMSPRASCVGRVSTRSLSWPSDRATPAPASTPRSPKRSSARCRREHECDRDGDEGQTLAPGREQQRDVASVRCCLDDPRRGQAACSRPATPVWASTTSPPVAAAASPDRAAPRPRRGRGGRTRGPPGRCSSPASSARPLLIVRCSTEISVAPRCCGPRRTGGPALRFEDRCVLLS
jgi:hypothetical protein